MKSLRLILVICGSVLFTTAAQANLIFEETFDVIAPAPDFTSTAAYVNWEFVQSPAGTQSSVGQAANLVFIEPGTGRFDSPRARAVISANAVLGGMATEFDLSTEGLRVQGDVKGVNTGGSIPGLYHVGLIIGGLRVIIHPGFNGFSGDGPQGAFAIRTIDDGRLMSNQDMGFIPAEGEFQTIDVVINDQDTYYSFDVSVGAYADRFSISKGDAGPLDQVGFSISDADGLEARFDNLRVAATEKVIITPEPSTIAIWLALGILAMGRHAGRMGPPMRVAP